MTSALHPSVVEAFPGFSVRFEGRVSSMYLDILGLVTVGVGNLIDVPSQAAALPFQHANGTGALGALATPAEITAAWHALKARQDLRKLHWKYAAALNDLRLSEGAIDALVRSKLESNARYIQAHAFPKLAEFPADAQLAIMSIAWAVGPGFALKFPNFARAAQAQRWLDAIPAAKIREAGNPGVVPRNQANARLLENAAHVVAAGLDPTVLYWPASVLAPVTVEV